mgnify:CR=1 FL=1
MVFRNFSSAFLLQCVVLGMLFPSSIVSTAANPRVYASIYVGLVRSISNDQLLKNYNYNLKELQMGPQNNDMVARDELRILRLPIFRVPVLKILVTEIERRKLIPQAELEIARSLITEKENLIKKGGEDIN